MHYRGFVWPSILAGLLVFFADRGQKFLQIEIFGWRGGEIVPVTPFFDYMLVWNPGVSYGLLSGLALPLLLAIMLVAMLALVWWWWTADTAMVRLGLALCLGGALSHIVDRVVYGAVADFFHFHWGTWSFYVFNISDSAITVGVILLAIDLLMPKRPAGN